MIIDDLKNLGAYAALNPGFGKTLRYLETVNLASLPDGRYAVDGDKVFINVGENALRPQDDALLEAHDRYIDIQIIIRGEERQGWRSRSECRDISSPMDAEKDIMFFGDSAFFVFALRKGQMSVFFPDDAHAPLIGAGTVRKAVVKVAVEQ